MLIDDGKDIGPDIPSSYIHNIRASRGPCHPIALTRTAVRALVEVEVMHQVTDNARREDWLKGVRRLETANGGR